MITTNLAIVVEIEAMQFVQPVRYGLFFLISNIIFYSTEYNTK